MPGKSLTFYFSATFASLINSAGKTKETAGELTDWIILSTLGVKFTTMPDDKSKTGPADDKRINIHEDYELTYWSNKFGVTKERIKTAVGAVGVMVADVKRYLGK